MFLIFAPFFKNKAEPYKGKGTTDALFLVQRLQEEHRPKDKRMYYCTCVLLIWKRHLTEYQEE